jgi:hypothetical protein
MDADSGASRHDFAFAAAYRLPALAFGITGSTSWVELGPGGLVVRFGPWRLRTPLANVAGAEQTGGFRYLKTVGPAHLSFSDRGVTFATNGDAAACVRFVEPVTVLDPTGRLRHPGATLTVADPDRFLAELDALRGVARA